MILKLRCCRESEIASKHAGYIASKCFIVFLFPSFSRCADHPVIRLQNPAVPQADATQQLTNNNMSLDDVRKMLKCDPDGKCLTMLGWDGVLRIFDENRNVLDAAGLNPAQIREYYEGLPMHERFLAADGRNIALEKWFHPDVENIPRKPTAEELTESNARFAEYKRSGRVCTPSDKAADGAKSKS